MAVQPQFLAYILEQLESLGAVRSRRMFGAAGLYSGELFFGLIDDDTVFFKSDASNSADYTARNMPRFMPFPGRPEAALAYYQVPADIIEDAESLVSWARKSVAVALTSQAAKNARKARPHGAAAKRSTRPKPGKKKTTTRKPAKKKAAARKARRRRS
jgi:DNA transformation protein and related proteins